MHYIFNSDVYLNYTNNIFEVEEPKKPEPNSEQKIEPKKPVLRPAEVENQNQDEHEIEYGETDEAAFSEKKQYFQKYLLYYKLRQLEYRLSDYKVLQTYKNSNDIKDFLKILTTFLKFYNSFNYKEASNIAINIITQFKKIK